MTCCNALASVVNELALKQHRTVDINLQPLDIKQLVVVSVVFF
jgi:hypothetical protein